MKSLGKGLKQGHQPLSIVPVKVSQHLWAAKNNSKDRVNSDASLLSVWGAQTAQKLIYSNICFIDILGSLPLWMRKETDWMDNRTASSKSVSPVSQMKRWKGTREREDWLNRSVACTV